MKFILVLLSISLAISASYGYTSGKRPGPYRHPAPTPQQPYHKPLSPPRTFKYQPPVSVYQSTPSYPTRPVVYHPPQKVPSYNRWTSWSSWAGTGKPYGHGGHYYKKPFWYGRTSLGRPVIGVTKDGRPITDHRAPSNGRSQFNGRTPSNGRGLFNGRGPSNGRSSIFSGVNNRGRPGVGNPFESQSSGDSISFERIGPYIPGRSDQSSISRSSESWESASDDIDGNRRRVRITTDRFGRQLVELVPSSESKSSGDSISYEDTWFGPYGSYSASSGSESSSQSNDGPIPQPRGSFSRKGRSKSGYTGGRSIFSGPNTRFYGARPVQPVRPGVRPGVQPGVRPVVRPGVRPGDRPGVRPVGPGDRPGVRPGVKHAKSHSSSDSSSSEHTEH